MRTLRAFLLPAALLIFTGCDTLGLDGSVRIRVRNDSDLTFEEGILYLVGDSILFPGLGPGQATPYREVEKSYRFATTQVVTGNGADTARLQVIDFVGEEPLDEGRYTFSLFFFEGNPKSLSQELEKDR